VDGASVLPHFALSFGFGADWAHHPLELRTAGGSVPPGGELVSHALGMDLWFSIGFLNRLEVAIGLPWVAFEQTDNRLARVPSGIAAAGIGDMRLDAKARVGEVKIPRGGRLGAAVIAGGSAPTATEAFIGQGGWTGWTRLVGELRTACFGLSAEIGALFRGTR